MDRLSQLMKHLERTDIGIGNNVTVQPLSGEKAVYTTLTEEQRKSYDDNGYLVVRGLLNQNECNILNQRFVEYARNPSVRLPESVLMTDITIPKVRNKKSAVIDVSTLTKINNIGHDAVYFKHHLSNQKILNYVRGFVGKDIRGLNYMHISKPPDTGSLSSRHPLHQDLWYYPLSHPDHIVAAWTALEFVGRRNGGLSVVPGSHKEGLHLHCYPDWSAVNFAYYGVCKKVYSRVAAQRVHLEMEPGDTVFFHPFLVHGSGANLSNGTRKAIVTHFLNPKVVDFVPFQFKEQHPNYYEQSSGKGKASKAGGSVGLKGVLDRKDLSKNRLLQLISKQIEGDVGYWTMTEKEIEFWSKHYFKRKMDPRDWKSQSQVMQLPEEETKSAEVSHLSFTEFWTKSGGEIISDQIRKIPDRNVSIRVIQIKAVEQESGDQGCGYYGIYFISKLSQILKLLSSGSECIESDHRSLDSLMRQLRCKESLLSFKSQIIEELLAECTRRSTGCYPWTADHIKSGVLERVYLQFLQNNYFRKKRLEMRYSDSTNDGNLYSAQQLYPQRFDESIAAKYGFRFLWDTLNLMEFSESSLRTNHLPLSTLDDLEYFFNESFRGGHEHHKIFLIASAIHYVVAAVYRHPDGGDIEVIYIDPQNNDVLNRSKSSVQHKVIEKMQFAVWLESGWTLQQMRQLAMDSFMGIQFAIYLVVGAVENNCRPLKQWDRWWIRQKIVSVNLGDGFLAGFRCHVLVPMMSIVNGDRNAMEPEDAMKGNEALDRDQWSKECEDVMDWIKSGMEMMTENEEQKMDDYRESMKAAANLIKQWISTYYPSAVIDQNIVTVLHQLRKDSFAPEFILKALHQWSCLLLMFADTEHRKLVGISDDAFWKRMSSGIWRHF